MKKEITVDRKKVFIFIKAALIGTVCTFLSVFLFSFLMFAFEMDRSYATAFATISMALGTFLASFYSAKKIGNKGYLTGLVIGVTVFAVITLVSLLINKSALGINTLFHLIIILLSSISGGILGVNKGKNKKYI